MEMNEERTRSWFGMQNKAMLSTLEVRDLADSFVSNTWIINGVFDAIIAPGTVEIRGSRKQ